MNIGFLIIGNEILSGRTSEKNLAVLARILASKGLRIGEARVINDVPDKIATTLNEMRKTCDVIFTSGGIGPTHDDVTVDGIALAFAVKVEENAQANAILTDFYARRDLPYTESRRRMARAPKGADILQSQFDGAPGFVMENVFICAGVPDIFAMMAEAAVATLPNMPLRHTAVLHVDGAESELAEALTQAQARWSEVEMGSYPRHDNVRGFYCHLVFAGTDAQQVEAAYTHMHDYLTQKGLAVCRIDEA